MQNLPFLLSIFVVLVSFIVLLYTLFGSRYTTKPIIITTLLITSLTNYFMNTYHVIIDESMLRNAFQIDIHESFSSGETVLKQIGTDAAIKNDGNAGKKKTCHYGCRRSSKS